MAEYVTLPSGKKVELSLDNPLFADFERLPATFEQFISDPYYLGHSWGNPFPAWKEAGKKLFPLPMKSPYNSVILLGATGIGKALLNGTGVLTPTGYHPIETLKVGDKVASNDGKFYNVTGVFPQGKQPCYEVEFTYGLKCKVSDQHIWTVSRNNGRSYHCETTEEILEKGFDKLTTSRKRQKVQLPEVAPLDIAPSQYSVSPYNLGYTLATKGSYKEQIDILPLEHFIGSAQERKEFLDGIVDAIGKPSKSGLVELSMSILRLAERIQFLAETLGYRVVRTASTENTIHPCEYTLTIYGNTLLGKRTDLLQTQPDKLASPTLVIRNISYIGEEECTCISIDAPNHLYLAEHCIPTHNTTFATNMVMAYYLHVVLCLRNPHKYFALEEQKNIVFAFINIVTKTIAYKNAWGIFHKALLKSPFFMEYGHATESNRPEWVCDRKPVELIYGSTADHIIGLDILACLTGDTVIQTSKGLEQLKDLVGQTIKVPTFNPETHEIEMSQLCTVKQTKQVTELIEIELENGFVIKCTPEHRLLLKSGIYKRADELLETDELEDINYATS